MPEVTPCDVCGDMNWDRDWHVSEEEWLAIVPKEWQDKTLCPWCFVKFAAQKGKMYHVRRKTITFGVEKNVRLVEQDI